VGTPAVGRHPNDANEHAYQPRASENELTRVDVVVMLLVLLATARPWFASPL
jgi:hypothetical protein